MKVGYFKSNNSSQTIRLNIEKYEDIQISSCRWKKYYDRKNGIQKLMMIYFKIYIPLNWKNLK